MKVGPRDDRVRVEEIESTFQSHHKSHHFRSVIGGVHSALFRFAGLEVPTFRDFPPRAVSRDSLLISKFSVRFRVGPLELRDRSCRGPTTNPTTFLSRTAARAHRQGR